MADYGKNRPLFAHQDTPNRGRADMEILFVILIAIAVYLFRDNKRVAQDLAVTRDPVERIKKQSGIGVGWIVIVMVVVFIVLAASGGGAIVNVGINPQGGIDLYQTPDPNNPFARPIGEVMGMHQDAQGHWTR
jgi:hypothetical protein